MRHIVFALILANLGFAAWQRWHAGGPPGVPVGEREFGDIVLAEEFAADNPAMELATVRIDAAELQAGAPDGVADAVQPATLAVDAVEFIDGAANVAPTDVAGTDTAAAADADTNTGPDAQADAAPAADAVAANDAAAAPAGDATDAAPADSESEPAAGNETRLAAASPAAGDGAIVCMSVGPFRELSQAAAAAANLREDGIEPRQRAGEGEIWSGYWVYLERIEGVAAAQSMIENLHANGIGDAYVIPNSDSGTLISLGVFSEIIRASRIREQVRALGYEATIADRVRRATVYWIDVDVPDGTLLDFERLQPPGRIVRLEQRPCGEVDL